MPAPWTKMPKVGVAPALIVVDTLGAIPEMHCPVLGFVSHRKTFTGRIAAPVSADTAILALAPTFTVATEKTPVPLVLGTFTIPSFVNVAASATISGIGVGEADNSRVLSPELMAAGLLFAQSKLSCTSVEEMGPVGVRAKTKVWAAPAAMATGVLGEPVT